MALSAGDPIWDSYCGARIIAFSLPPSEIERAGELRAAAALRHCLGLDAADAAYQARRCFLYRREVLLHEVFTLNLAPLALDQILDAMDVVGSDQLRDIGPGQGVILLSLHYSLYSSLLTLWLAQATVRGLFKDLTVLVLSNPSGSLRPPQRRLEQLEQAGIWSLTRTTLVDRRLLGAPWAARKLAACVNGGGAVVILLDALFLPAGSERTLTLSIGRQNVGVQRGAAWLVRSTGAPVVPVHIHPHGDDGHAIVFDSPVCPATETDGGAAVQGIMQRLLEQTVLADPGPWEGWLREGFAQAIGQ